MTNYLDFDINMVLPLKILVSFIIIYLVLLLSINGLKKKENIFRIILLSAFTLLIVNPYTNREKTSYYNDIVLLVSDYTLSISETNKTENILSVQKKIIDQLAEFSNLELKKLEIENKISQQEDENSGTFIINRIKEEINEVNKKRMASIIVITDGQTFEKPKALDELKGIPLHFIIVGKKNEKDRVVITENVPDYAVVGKNINFILKIKSWKEDKKAKVTIRLDGVVVLEKNFVPNIAHNIEIPIEHSGENILEIKVDNNIEEITFSNNDIIKSINGIHERLRVMLISGQPNMGLRTWRNILNSDPAIELVHFTILRPPSKRDLTPVKELSLIPFPTQELFAADLSKFSLIIFDQYSLQGVLPEKYLNNIAQFVSEGGALLDIAGVEHANQSSINNSAISSILPSKSKGEVSENPFIPKLTETGKKHPITNSLRLNDGDEKWGKWFRHIKAEKLFGKTLMQNNNFPIMIISDAGEGRVAQILSDQSWIWIKSSENKGPLIGLLRNTIHWLLKTPELEENFLKFSKKNKLVTINLNTLKSQNVPAKIYYPSKETTDILLKNNKKGLMTGVFETQERGRHKISYDGIEKFFYPINHDISELKNVVSSDKKLKEIAALNSNVSINWTIDKIPKLAKIYNDNIFFGKNWIGLIEKKMEKKNSYSKQSLFEWFIFLPIIIILYLFVWYRESKS